MRFVTGYGGCATVNVVSSALISRRRTTRRNPYTSWSSPAHHQFCHPPNQPFSVVPSLPLPLSHSPVQSSRESIPATLGLKPDPNLNQCNGKPSSYMDQLARREPEIWEQGAVHILKRQPNDYARAVSLLTDLHDLAVRRGQESQISDLNLRRSGRRTPPPRRTSWGKRRQRLISARIGKRVFAKLTSWALREHPGCTVGRRLRPCAALRPSV
jgi:hypothetical protein